MATTIDSLRRYAAGSGSVSIAAFDKVLSKYLSENPNASATTLTNKLVNGINYVATPSLDALIKKVGYNANTILACVREHNLDIIRQLDSINANAFMEDALIAAAKGVNGCKCGRGTHKYHFQLSTKVFEYLWRYFQSNGRQTPRTSKILVNAVASGNIMIFKRVISSGLFSISDAGPKGLCEFPFNPWSTSFYDYLENKYFPFFIMTSNYADIIFPRLCKTMPYRYINHFMDVFGDFVTRDCAIKTLAVLFERYKDPEIETFIDSLIGQFAIDICSQEIIVAAAKANYFKIASDAFREGFDPTPGLMGKVCAVAHSKKFVELLVVYGADAGGDAIVSAAKNVRVQVIRELIRYPTVDVSYNDNEAFNTALVDIKTVDICSILAGHKTFKLKNIYPYSMITALDGVASISTITKIARMAKKEDYDSYLRALDSYMQVDPHGRNCNLIKIFKKIFKIT